MATTVQIKNDTKAELLIIKAQLEQQSGKKHTLEDAIRWLIEKSKTSGFEERKKISETCFGSIKDLNIQLSDVTELRRQRSSRIADF